MNPYLEMGLYILLILAALSFIIWLCSYIFVRVLYKYFEKKVEEDFSNFKKDDNEKRK